MKEYNCPPDYNSGFCYGDEDCDACWKQWLEEQEKSKPKKGVSKTAEYVYCAVDERNNIKLVQGSSRKTKYFKTTKYLEKAVGLHNFYYDNDPWRIGKFELIEVAMDEGRGEGHE